MQLAKGKAVKAGVILSSVGSLAVLQIRLAGANQVLIKKGKFEIVSLTGTFSESGIHLHIAVADEQGAVIGGHLLEGCLIHTTCELVVLDVPGVGFKRQLDDKTGYLELKISVQDK
jgi:predicted DNA-binding protein with PD1-like motif